MSIPSDPTPPAVTSDMQTDYVVGQDNIQGRLGPFGFDIHNRVFVVSALASIIFIVLTLLFPQQAGSIFQSIVSFSTGTLDSYFMIVVDGFILFCLALVVLPYGKVRLGGPDARPDHGYLSWFAMLFAAGIGIGLLFFGVLEPVYHANVSLPLGIASPFGADGALNPNAIADATAMGLAGTYLHWGIHGWAVYVVMALALSIFTYNKGLPFSIRSAFFPILGERVWGWWGHAIDILAVFSTLFGLATSLGLGAQQANAGMNFVFGLDVNATTQVIVIVLVTAVALVSVWRGLEGGVKKLSEINMVMAVLFFFFVLFAGPTLAALSGFWTGLETYVTEFMPLSAPFGREDDAYRQAWTIFYWAWWVSWAPFVGMFIARVSRGRTVREFVICVLLIPSLFIFIWMGVFGATALDQLYANPAGSLVKEYVIDNYSPELSLFGMLNELPLSGLMSTLGIILALIFFVTSSDSGSLVIDTITAGGKIDAPRPQRMFWAAVEGLIAIVLLLGGGLSALQAGVTATAIPFSIVMILMCYSIIRALNGELRQLRRQAA
ncbi:BCCT family transporter [Halomonas elongata]|uniref:BCC family transport protein BetG (Substrate glycine-betaine) n=3 Tax=Halomonas elongata TaxID=2746 RepID=E1V7B4_HALED|nr:BCCT family transporter [Halomonas elongata]OBX37739.1 glycine betaine transporter OpuD [Halomonas elongata]WBF18700.1 BCCT family transporter [Halomonas elongata]WPU47555.1 BCCT family transporter [Halomonas elongata DSM 2581]CBV41464.1 BCC family transport protein BetG (substrate glycine-betaine) [Halomonas elongata DSM 2581]